VQSEDVTEQINDLLLPLLRSYEVELVDLEFVRTGKRWILRLFLDKPGGITIDDCAQLSRITGEVIDVHELIDHAYTLEVSSPGLNRPIKKTTDYQRFAGRLARLTVRQPDGKSLTLRGKLLGLEGDQVILQEDDRIHRLNLNDIARARLDFDFKER
jgi:ribosome maturation factor RimP